MPIFLFIALIGILHGCGSLGTVLLKVEVNSHINPDKYNQALPVILKCYQLNSDKKFRELDFNSLWKEGNILLEKNIISSKEILILPDNNQEHEVKLDYKTKYVGCACLFNRPEDTSWKAIVEVRKGILAKSIELRIINNTISINDVKNSK